MDHKVYKFEGGDICMWMEKNGTIMLKAVDPISGTDPVELGDEEAKELAETMLRLLEEYAR